MNNDGSQLVTLVAQQGLTLNDLTCSQLSGGVAGFAVNGQTCISSRAGVTNSTKHTSQAGQKILLTLVGNVVSNFVADSSHRVRTGSHSGQVARLESTTTVQNDADLLVSFDLAGGQGRAIRQTLKIA